MYSNEVLNIAAKAPQKRNIYRRNFHPREKKFPHVTDYTGCNPEMTSIGRITKSREETRGIKSRKNISNLDPKVIHASLGRCSKNFREWKRGKKREKEKSSNPIALHFLSCSISFVKRRKCTVSHQPKTDGLRVNWPLYFQSPINMTQE